MRVLLRALGIVLTLPPVIVVFLLLVVTAVIWLSQHIEVRWVP